MYDMCFGHDKTNTGNTATTHTHTPCRKGSLDRSGITLNLRTIILLHSTSKGAPSLFRWPGILLVLTISSVSPVFSMRLVIQRVASASVTVDGNTISSIGPGILALVGVHEHDTEQDLTYCCKRLLAAKLWENANGGMWRHGVKQKDFEVLCVSQFTLYGTLSKKNQPDFKLAMKALPAQRMYNQFLEMLRRDYQPDKIADGKFGAMMDVALVNDGPVTLVIESEPQLPSESGLSETSDGEIGTES